MGKNTVIPCEQYSRIVGYYQILKNWNLGKKSEFNLRKTYKIIAEELANEKQHNRD